jgi:hypothetical protein
MEKEYKSGAGKYINREMTSEQTRAGFTTRRRVAVLKLRGKKKTKPALKINLPLRGIAFRDSLFRRVLM